MNNKALSAAPLLAGLVLLSGCASTLNGAKQDATNDTQAVQQAGSQATQAAQQAGNSVVQATSQVGQDVKQTAADAKAAAVLTPDIKTAIIRDPVLNDPHNEIHVNTGAKTVRLTEHVMDPTMKTRADQDAQVVLTHHHAAQTISDELTMTGS